MFSDSSSANTTTGGHLERVGRRVVGPIIQISRGVILLASVLPDERTVGDLQTETQR